MAYQKLGFKNGNVLTAEQLIHMEDGIIAAEKKAQEGGNTGTGLPSGGEPYMQLVTDADGKWVAEKRLAWSTLSEEEILGATVPFAFYDEVGFYCNDPEKYKFYCKMLEPGKKYTIIFDGQKFPDLICYEGKFNVGCTYIGAQEQKNGKPFLSSEMPFQFMTIPQESGVADRGEIMVATILEGELHQIFVYEVAGTIHPISPEYLPEGIGYKSVGEVELVSNVSVSSETASFDVTSPLEEGKEYTVIWDGVTYKCIAREYDGYIMIGNNAIYEYDDGATEDTGEPFAIETQDGGTKGDVYFASDDTNAHTLSIKGLGSTIHPIPEEYLPTQLFCINITPAPAEYSDYCPYVADKSYREVKEAEAQKRPIIGTFNHTDGRVFTIIGCDAASASCYFVAFDVSSEPALFRLDLRDVEWNAVYVDKFQLNWTEQLE